MFKCSLTVQGFPFEAVGISKKSARNTAVDQAFAQFTLTPPPVVNEKKRKYPAGKDGGRSNSLYLKWISLVINI